jgi:alanine racemase
MRWTAEVSMVKRVAAGESVSYGHRYAPERESTIATVGVGYADGFARRLTNVGQVLIRGGRHGVAGTVTMDQILVDVGDAAVEPGDEVVLIGSQGGERITADEIAGHLGTISYEVVCGVGERVPRRYRG